MNHKTILTTSIVAALAATALLAGCSSRSSPAPGVTPAAVAHDPVVAYSQYQTTSQLAEGLARAGVAALDVGYYRAAHGKLPTDNTQAESAGSEGPAFSGSGKYVQSVTVGPAPGRITVLWSHGKLAGESLVLSPAQQGPSYCYRVDPATTVPAAVLAHATIVNKCQSEE